ncbi:methionine ABC transporter ATP-binding protein [Paenibacillus pinistramenti]|uniref:methionine ABC transporter ATP-binding protein n=1 Tax=Paenibacillus pinistramenti TaxID=1768003 RepID=UPI0011080509|nr:methionine ABC transporter ATP-binding protein [Paenibacillus pinistramenti]
MISLKQVGKSYGAPGKPAFSAVDDVTLDIRPGTIHGIIGQSGAGKSTLLRMMNMLERPDTGQVWFDGRDLTDMPEHELREIRRQSGMIFQQFHLLHNRTAARNVEMPLELAGVPKKQRKQRAQECLAITGLLDKAGQYPAALSGGQKQRVAIARALAHHPKVLLCDEPTSALDPKTTAEILSVLWTINRRLGVTIVIVTHEMEVVRRICDEVSVMEDGRLTDQFRMPQRRAAGSGSTDGEYAGETTAEELLFPPPASYREQLLGKKEGSEG